MVHVSEPPTAPAAPEMHVVWVTALPGVPKVRLHNPVLAYENGDEFLAILRRAAEGRLDPFILVFEGSVPDEKLSGEGYWAAFGDDPQTGQPMSTCAWIDRLAPRAWAVMAAGTCATYRGIHAMAGNPHGGTVEAANRKDRSGAVFKVRLPRRSIAAEPPRPAERHPAAEGTVWLESAPSLEGLRVLVVDDEADARELIATVITRCGGEATAVGSAAQAYEALRRDPFDVLIADIEMPDEDGYEFMRSVRILPPEQGSLVPAVALTAYASAQDRVKALGAGFQMHVPKPVQPAELAAVVASLGKPATRPR